MNPGSAMLRHWLLAALALGACSRGGGPEARARLEAAAAPASFDWSRPLAALELDAGEAARRLGSLDYAASVTWTATRGAERLRAVERHEVRQLASGPFRALLELDPGTWPGAESGREVIFVDGMTYAHGRYAPFRQRPTDRGRDARRFRDESFRLGADLARLVGPGLRAVPVGETQVLGRTARRFALSLAREAAAPAPPPSQLPAAGYDEETRRRLDLLEDRVVLVLEGELVLDAETGVPLQVKMKALLGEKADPKVRAELDLDAHLSGWGAVVGAVAAPRNALPDERKPRGVARALDQAGLRQRAEGKAEEPEEEGDAEGD